MKRINWDGAGYKDWVGLSAAPVFWVASLICFVLGLAFKGDGVFLPGIPFDLSILFSLGLGFANTAVQIVGNDTDRGDLGMALLLMWVASYMLGIGSNVNFLYQKIGLDSQILQFLVCWGLGVMIEVAPERLLVKFLRAIGVLGNIKSFQPQIQTPRPQPNLTQYQNIPRQVEGQNRNQRHEEFRQQARPALSQSRPKNIMEPQYHSVGQDDPNLFQPIGDLPPFLERGKKNGTMHR